MATAPVRSWEETLGLLKAADGSIVWEGLVAHLVSAFYSLPMSAEDKADLRGRMAYLVEGIEAEVALGDFPPPSVEAYTEIVAGAFDGLAIDVQLFVSQATPTAAEEETS